MFRSARDLLLARRDDYAAASRDFSWPQLGEFNWALDWFDVLAREHPDRLALWIVTEDGPDTRLSYAELSARSDQVATWLRGLGVGRGDRVLLMLGNQAPLWEVILAAMKLGAVIIPATTLLGPDDIADRISRGGVRHVITESDETGKFAGLLGGGLTPIAVGRRSGPGIQRGLRAERPLRARRRDARGRSAAALFHLRYHRAAQARGAQPRLLPGRAPVHHVLARPPARRRAPEHLLARLGNTRGATSTRRGSRAPPRW